MDTSSHEDIESVDPKFVKFDRCIGCIEEIIISEEFMKIQHNFITKHCIMFDDKEENKLIYTSIFQDYAQLAEKYLEQKLKQMIPNFSMKEFCIELNHQPVLDGEVFDMLRECIDFFSFKAMMVDFKKSQNIDNLLLSGFKISPD
ncbi:ADP-ribosylation factor-like protein 2-binding protein [Daphnia magna]|uniref:ADP-ribosylation factor-like protein 2-binding protein n=1 Tax=Daphnia magna TaxID=35525 RepID=UPI0006DDC0B0|nr:ADP-ribosylation factor-like protein 2-binding protein [Daphnia magna]